MAGEKILFEKECKDAKTKLKMYYLNDGGGLRLRCRPDGGKTWMFRYRFNGIEKSVGIGSYPKTTLKIARAAAEQYRALILEGKNPTVEKKVRKAKRVLQDTQTFSSIARDWLDANKADWSEKHLKRNEGLINLYLNPDLGRLPIQEIEESYLFSVLKPVYDKGRKESARRARGIAAQIFDYGIDTYRCTSNPAKNMRNNKYFKKPIVNHLKALAKEDVPSLIADLRKTGEKQRLKPQTVCGLFLILYTGHRDFALRRAKWQEFDMTKQTWTMPGEIPKGTKEAKRQRPPYEVSLPTQAIAALTELKPITFRGPESYVFSGKSKTGHMSENTLRLALHRLGYKVTAHGMRSLITNVLNENGFNADAVERQLGHKERNEVRRAYLRSDFIEERIRMMQWFADWCEGKVDDSASHNVVSIQGRR
jgi:integrase